MKAQEKQFLISSFMDLPPRHGDHRGGFKKFLPAQHQVNESAGKSMAK